ncbi:MAG: protocatechuate 3,4-dioxygenase subunit alpha [Burkholderiales bacterium]
MSLLLTAAQTVGPYVAIGFEKQAVPDVAPAGVAGERVVITGKIFDGDGQPVTDGVIETWQANSYGKYAHPDDAQEKLLEENFRGFGRVLTDTQGGFRLTTIKPGKVAGVDGKEQAPHITVVIFMRGLLKHLMTRIYFPDDAVNAADAVLNLVPAARRSTLIATRSADGTLRWDVHLQGPHETVFFDY